MERDSIDLGSQQISKLFRQYFIPTLLGMLSMSSVTTIDGIFIGHGVGSLGIAAVNITLPIIMAICGLGLMVGIGCSVVVAIHLSHHKEKTARMNIVQALVFVSMITFFIAALVLIFPEQAARLLGASETLIPFVTEYLIWVAPSLFFQMWAEIGLFVIRLDGAPRIAMWCNIVTAIANIVLDWLFIFPLNWGIKGAALASSISITLGGLIAIWYMMFKAKTLYLQMPKWSRKSLRLSLRNIGYQCKIGSSALLGDLTLATLMYMGNIIFMQYLGDDGVGAFGVVCYYMPFVFMIGNAIAQSAQPIISFNYGKGFQARVDNTRKTALKTALLFGIGGTLLFVIFPKPLVELFINLDTNAAQIALKGFPYFASGLVFFIINLTLIGYFQSIEKIKPATFFAILRGFICLIPAFILLPKILGTIGIWLALPLSEFTTFLVIVLTLTQKKKTVAK